MIAIGAEMTCRRQRYDFPSHFSGDTFPGLSFTIVKNSLPFDLSDCNIDITFVHEENAAYTYTLDTGNGVAVTNDTGGIFQVDEQIINFYPGLYNYDITIETADTGLYTWVYGTWSILDAR